MKEEEEQEVRRASLYIGIEASSLIDRAYARKAFNGLRLIDVNSNYLPFCVFPGSLLFILGANFIVIPNTLSQ